MTYQQVLDFLNVSSQYAKGQNNKLTYAINKVAIRLKPIVDKYNETVTDYSIDMASVDEKGNLIMNGNNYSFTPAKQKELNKKCREFRQTECAEFQPYIATELPKDLDEFLMESFKGFVI